MWVFAKKPFALIRALLISLRKCPKIGFADLPVKHCCVSEGQPVDPQCCGGLHREVLAVGWTPQSGHSEPGPPKSSKPGGLVPSQHLVHSIFFFTHSSEPWEPHLTVQCLLSCFTLKIWMVPPTCASSFCWSESLKCTWMKQFTKLLPLAFHTHILETSLSPRLVSSSTRSIMLHSRAAAECAISRYCRSLSLGHQMSPTAPLPSEAQP